jgi:hypothetical protein
MLRQPSHSAAGGPTPPPPPPRSLAPAPTATPAHLHCIQHLLVLHAITKHCGIEHLCKGIFQSHICCPPFHFRSLNPLSVSHTTMKLIRYVCAFAQFVPTNVFLFNSIPCLRFLMKLREESVTVELKNGGVVQGQRLHCSWTIRFALFKVLLCNIATFAESSVRTYFIYLTD